MGSFRFALATMVALYHISRSMPIELGISAVLCFYFLSGYYMAGLYQKFLINSKRPKISFYFDRCFRLLPVFWLAFLITLCVYLIDDTKSIIIADPNFKTHVFLEFLVIPYSFINSFFSNAANINPQTWSLGVEFIFYLFVPLLALLSGRQIKIFLLIIFLIYIVSIFFFGHLHLSDLFGGKETCLSQLNFISGLNYSCHTSIANIIYRIPVFSCMYFILGYCWAIHFTKTDKKYSILILCLSFLGLFLYSVEKQFWQIFSMDEILWAGIIFIPMTCLVVEYAKWDDPLDKILGRLSYPLFLSHIFAIRLVNVIQKNNSAEHNLFLKFFLAVLVAYVFSLLQQYLDNKRYQLRGFRVIRKHY